ncbi:leukotoxin LktA family filamentous adhesin [Phascolarctobacterium succinatutens]|uniref:leukotoxin LktA family filamentous adhesin n=1 Tax=Phascolarctobacterium succinatutens TaxID=626940 RepID=UPI0026EF070A|nr:leukotoxin LktA family filamentous adhesin [Phascolarctobacterium succinatutens]
MGITRRFLRNMDKVTLSNIGKAATLQKVVSTVTAMGFVLQPMAAMASTITRADAPNTNLANGAVTNIWAEKVVGDVAVNKFDKFQLDANNIANMYFKQSPTGAEAGNLVNFVNSRIDINGTVNAIKGSSVGGNLFFLSKDGMAVGKTGVINAGALYVAAPTSAAYIKYQIEANLKKLVDIKGSEGFASIPINASGTITVLGKVNAVNEIQLRAAKIGVGKNVSGETVFGVAAGATAGGAALNTGIENFTDLVNVKDTAGKTLADAGLAGTLTASKDAGSGDIVLAASADTVNTDTGFASALGSGVKGDTVQAVVEVAKDATITAKDGNIEITADASNDKGFLKKAASTSVAELFGGKVSKVEAKINIDGTLEAKSINIAANAENSYEKDSWTNVGTISGVLADSAMNLIPVDQLGDAKDKIDIAFAKLASNAEVNVGADARLNATGTAKFETEPDKDTGMLKGGALNISATSQLKAEIGAEVEAPDAPAEAAGGKAAATPVSNRKNKNSLSSVLPSAGIAVADTENNASVIVKGNLQSKGDTNISAHAINEVEAEAAFRQLKTRADRQEVLLMLLLP